MTILYLSLILIGLVGVGFGFWGQENLHPPYDTVSAVVLPLSLMVGLLGVLLLCVPHFFG